MLVRPEHPENAYASIIVTDSGIVTLVSPLQHQNASLPILVTGNEPKDDGIVIAPVVEAGTVGDDEELPLRVASPLETV